MHPVDTPGSPDVPNFLLVAWRRRLVEWLRFLGWRRVAASTVVAVTMLAVLAWMFLPSGPMVDPQIPAASGSGPAVSLTVVPPRVRVHVTGAVRRPGVYELASTDRVIDAVTAAGGPSAGADLEGINLAQTLLDTEQILVPHRTPHAPHRKPAPRLRPTPRPRPAPLTTVATSAPGATDSGAVAAPTTVPASGKVNLNTATAAELDALPGIGPTTARAIIEHRRTKGPFRKVDDLLNVAGIGPTRFARIKSLVSV